MKRKQPSKHGFASLPAITGLALMLTLSLAMLFRGGLMNRDQASKAQLRTDYAQREEALLRALAAVFPKKAIACMKGNQAASNDYSWDTIFKESIAMANSAESLSEETITELGLTRMRRGDVADLDSSKVQAWITSLTDVAGNVTPGVASYAGVFNSAGVADRVPPLLETTADLEAADALRPIVSISKRYHSQDPGLLANITKYGVYNLIPYPNIRFGYAAPGQPFVAKRNWWAFKIKFGDAAGARQGDAVPVVEKQYVLSLYEIPSQLPIEGTAFAEIGRHLDGQAWNSTAISISGGVYANQVSLSGDYGAERVSGREAIKMEGNMTLDGVQVGEDFDAPGVREQLQVEQRSDVLPVALSANSGRLTFMPIQRGSDYLKLLSGTVNAWDAYSVGAQRCRVTVEATAMVSIDDQTPTAIRVRFATPAGTTKQVVLTRGVNWPSLLETGGDAIPFQTELTNAGRSCLAFSPSLFDAWLAANGGASAAVNNSICFRPDPTADPVTVKEPNDPPNPEDLSIVIRKGKDLTSFTQGLSVVAPLRVYVGDDLNVTPATPPLGSGLASTAEYYPPLSIASAELRIGTTSFNRPFEHHGQVFTLRPDGSKWSPLDVKSGSDDAVHADTISADLKPLASPAELPPVYQMNWLVVIEEIPRE